MIKLAGSLAAKAAQFAAIMLPLAIGACSTPAIPNQQSIAGLAPSGTVSLTENFVSGATAGRGSLNFQGQTYPFRLFGTLAGPGVALTRIDAAGEVYGLNNVSDFAGLYTQGSGAPGLNKPSAGDLWLQNKAGVIMRLRDRSSGVMLSLGRDEIPDQDVALMSVRTIMAVVLAGLLACGATSGARAQQPTSIGQPATNPSGWTFNAAPYLWLPTLHTTLNYSLPPALDGKLETDLSVGPGDIVSHLNFATAFAADAQHGPFSLLTDFLYLNLSATNAHFKSLDFVGLPSQPISRSVQTSTGTRLGSTLWTLAGGYTVAQGDWGNLDVIAGFRYFGVNATTNYSLALTVVGPRGNGATFGGVGGVSGSSAIWNGIGGFRGRIRLGHTGLFIPYYFDAGAGGSNLTWEVASGLGYQTGWVAGSLTYRYLSFDQGNSGVVQRLSMGGPMLMVDFSF